jgi:integrase
VVNNWYWFRTGIRALLSYRRLANAKLDEITNELAAEFGAYRMSHGIQVSSVNGSLRVLRRALRLAEDWGVLETAPVISLFPGEGHRERVVTQGEESAYLEKAPEPLRFIATVLADTGLRPDECYRMRWEELNWNNGRFGTVLITRGKTAAARRIIPMTPRVRFVLEARWEIARKPLRGWVWPAPTKSGHVDHSSLKKQHARAFRLANAEIKKRNMENNINEALIQPWVLYSFRHTFLTRLGESGCDAWTLARIAGHSGIAISSRYVHPSEDAVLNAMSKLGGHNFGYSQIAAEKTTPQESPQVIEEEKEGWCARRDSNSRPNAPEAFALSS